ncbi:MAG: TIGR00270 family protein [Nanoarchaeota archaeon]|nr:TIGR00270 family protein [Nanoarchaeota archaeon]
MQCDLCGKDRQLLRAKIEGSILDVCPECTRFGEIIKTPRPIFLQQNKKHSIRKAEPEKIEIIIPNYYVLIKQARERKGLTQEEAAMKIAEKQSLYNSIEKGQIKPSLPLAKKLENFFGIKLTELYDDKMQAAIASAPIRKDTLTIGDIIRTKKQ